jgi:hypothetical protein
MEPHPSGYLKISDQDSKTHRSNKRKSARCLYNGQILKRKNAYKQKKKNATIREKEIITVGLLKN